MRRMATACVHIIGIMFVFPLHTSAQILDWAKQLGNAEWDKGIAITTDGNGNVYTIGSFTDTLDLDPGPGTFNLAAYGMQDIFVSKSDTFGNLIWAKQIGGTGWEEANAITVDPYGNLYITGSFLGTCDFDPGATTYNLTSTGDIDIFTCKLDPSGAFTWVKQIGGTLAVNAYAIATDDSGNVYTTGYFDATADLDPGPGTFTVTAVGYSDIFVSKLDPSGGFVWARHMGGQIGEVGYGIAVDNAGNVYTTGIFTGTVDFDPGAATFPLSSPGPGDGGIFVSKLDASGNFAWAKQLAGGEEARTMALDDAGNVYIGGAGYYAWNGIAISKIDPSGNILWTKEMMANSCYGLSIDGDQNIYFTGQFFGTKDFDPGVDTFNMTSISNSDSYISKLDSAGTFVWAKQFGGTDQVWSQSLAVGGNDIVYTTGYFSGTADFDPAVTNFDLTSVGSYDVFIHKMKPGSLGIRQTNGNCVLRTYPNPTNGAFTIEFENGCSGADIVLKSLMGQVIDTKQVNDHHVEMNIKGPNGVYILEVRHKDGETSIYRIVKN